MKQFTFYKLLAAMLMLMPLVSCQSMNGAVGGYFDLDTDLQVDFKVDADINPDELGKASPLFLRMYELKSRKMFGKSDFIDIYERDKDVLGADLITMHKLRRFKPGESRTEHFVLDKTTLYVGFYAEFLEFKDSKYKLIVPVVANNVFRNSVIIRVSGNQLILEESVEEDPDYDTSGLKEGAKKADESAGKVKKLF